MNHTTYLKTHNSLKHSYGGVRTPKKRMDHFGREENFYEPEISLNEFFCVSYTHSASENRMTLMSVCGEGILTEYFRYQINHTHTHKISFFGTISPVFCAQLVQVVFLLYYAFSVMTPATYHPEN